jgi:hypothetical protein
MGATTEPVTATTLQARTTTLDDRLKVWDMVIKGVGGLILVVGTVWGYLDYRSKEAQRYAEDVKYRESKDTEARRYQEERDAKAAQESKQRSKEFKLKLYEERWPLYAEACRAAARIASSETAEEAKPSVKRFLELYYGEMCLVEDADVESAMIDFKHRIEEAGGQPTGKSPEVRRSALRLAIAAQKGLDLADVFDVQLGDQKRKLGGEASLKK